jgi:hypothetical protein
MGILEQKTINRKRQGSASGTPWEAIPVAKSKISLFKIACPANRGILSIGGAALLRSSDAAYCTCTSKALTGLWLASFLIYSGVIRIASSIACMILHMAAWMGKCEVCLHSRFNHVPHPVVLGTYSTEAYFLQACLPRQAHVVPPGSICEVASK